MNIALIGYGKMGKAIEKIALNSGHTIVCKFSNANFNPSDLSAADVAIEFTKPDAAYPNILKCLKAQIPVVVGTTGWYSDFNEVKKTAEASGGALFHATNFSLGVNIFFEINKMLAALMNNYESYEPSMFEAHHIQKKDAPSGTAITLAEGLIDNFNRKKSWVSRDAQNIPDTNPFDLEIECLREGEIPGTHTITYRSEVDEISITHQAYNRIGFASGAVKAAEWLVGKKGVFTMADMLGFNNK